TSEDSNRLVDALLELGVAGRRIDRDLLRRDLEHHISRYYGQPLSELAVGPVLGEALGIVRRHSLRLPPNLALLFKTIIMAEALAARLDPSFHLIDVLVPYARRLMLRQYSPTLWMRRLGRTSLDAARLGVDLPQHVRRVIGELERGGIEVGMRPAGFEPVLRRLEKLLNRLILCILIASFVNGLAVLMSIYHPLGWERWIGLTFTIGFAAAGVLGLYLVLTIFRSGRS